MQCSPKSLESQFMEGESSLKGGGRRERIMEQWIFLSKTDWDGPAQWMVFFPFFFFFLSPVCPRPVGDLWWQLMTLDTRP